MDSRSLHWPQKVIRPINKRKFPPGVLTARSNSWSGSFRNACYWRLEKHCHVPTLFLHSSLSTCYCPPAAAEYWAKWVLGLIQCSCSCKVQKMQNQSNLQDIILAVRYLIQRETVRGASKSLKNWSMYWRALLRATGQTYKSCLNPSLPIQLWQKTQCRGEVAAWLWESVTASWPIELGQCLLEEKGNQIHFNTHKKPPRTNWALVGKERSSQLGCRKNGDPLHGKP